MSWTPAANASSVGARVAVICDSWAETADGVIGGGIDVEGCSSEGWVGGLRDLRMTCWEGSRREVSTSSRCGLRDVLVVC